MKSILLAVVALVTAVAVDAHAQVRHVPPAAAEAGKPLELVVKAPPSTAPLVLHLRARGETAFSSLELVRRDGAWVAIVPATTVVPPALEYYLTAGDAVVFATVEWPHGLVVEVPAEDARRTRDQVRYHGHRSRIHALVDWIDFGDPPPGSGPVLTDRYYRIDADFAYRLWAYPLEEIRVGYTRLIGETAGIAAGFKLAGWFELGLAPVEGVHLDGRLIVMANQSGFAAGVRGEARLGDRDASHVALGAEYLDGVGATGFFRLGWGTVPRLPMSATVEISNLPSPDRETGVRLYYEVSFEVVDGLRIGLRAGYAARNQAINGFTGGAGATVEF
ncbi:MAG: hypothetical protein NT062_12120 [Proteobacteria bacterium]|nr:hypothetical protein [Pseudomonadota bacterium]